MEKSRRIDEIEINETIRNTRTTNNGEEQQDGGGADNSAPRYPIKFIDNRSGKLLHIYKTHRSPYKKYSNWR